MRKGVAVLFTALLAASVLAGCGNSETNTTNSAISSTIPQTNTTKYNLDSLSFRIDSTFTSQPYNKGLALQFLDKSKDNEIYVSKESFLSLEDTKQDIEDEITSNIAVKTKVRYFKKETIHKIEGLHLTLIQNDPILNENTNINTFVWETKDREVFRITYSSKILNSDQIDKKLQEIIATIELED